MTVALTKHGEERLGERLGRKGQGKNELAQRAFVKGKNCKDFGKELHNYLENVLLYSKGDTLKVWGGAIWIFGNHKLITSWPIPQKLWEKEKRRNKYGR